MDSFGGASDIVFYLLAWLSVIFVGLVFGSFTTAIAYRVPRGIPWAFGAFDRSPDEMSEYRQKEAVGANFSAYRSACPRCHAPLQAIDLVPLYSWFSTGGKCRYCHAAISRVYPVTEISMLVAIILTFAAFGFTFDAVMVALMLPFLGALLIVDLERMILPNQLVLIVAAIGVVRDFGLTYYLGAISMGEMFITYILAAPLYALLAWILGWAMTHFMKKDALGMGDVKFFAAAGLWLGVTKLGFFCILSGFFGFAFALLWRHLKQSDIFPFGPALIAALYVLLLLEGVYIL